jgi:hypothetical protein
MEETDREFWIRLLVESAYDKGFMQGTLESNPDASDELKMKMLELSVRNDEMIKKCRRHLMELD